MAETTQKAKRRFSTVERSFVANNLTKLSPEEIGKHLGRSPKSVIKVIKSLTQTVESGKAEQTQAVENVNNNSNGMKAGDLMAKRPGVTMMTGEASQALDEFKKSSQHKVGQHEKNIFRIRDE